MITETAPIANHFLGVFETPLANNSSMISNSTGCAKEDLNSTVIRLEEDNLTTLFTIVCSTLAVLAISIFIFWKVSDKPASKRSSGGETKPEVVLIKGIRSTISSHGIYYHILRVAKLASDANNTVTI